MSHDRPLWFDPIKSFSSLVRASNNIFSGRQLKNVPSQLVMMDEIEIEEEEEDAEGSTICEVIARMQRINRERTESETRNDLNKEEENAKSRKAYLKLRNHRSNQNGRFL